MSSECSGCQSGWTIYLVHSSDEQSSQLSHKNGGRFQPEEELEEDLSMVSDASSWPPHFSAPTDGGKKGRVEAEQPQKLQHAVLEDTASSSRLLNNTNKNNFGYQSKRPVEELLQLDSSCDLSTTQSKVHLSHPFSVSIHNKDKFCRQSQANQPQQDHEATGKEEINK